MNVSGKSLQDIFDAGAGKLEDLANSEKGALKGAAEQHLDERVHSEPDALRTLEAHNGELEAEIRAYLTKGMTGIEKAIKDEIETTSQHTERLVESLALLARRFNQAVEQLKNTCDGNMNEVAADSDAIYMGHVERVGSQLHRGGKSTVSDFRSGGSASVTKISSEAQGSFQALLQQENQLKNDLYASFSASSEQLNSTVEEGLKKLDESCGAATAKIEEQSSAAESTLRKQVKEMLEDLKNVVSGAESNVKNVSVQQVQKSSGSYEKTFSRMRGELTSLHTTAMGELSLQCQTMNKDVEDMCSTIEKAIVDKDAQVRSHAESLMDAYNNDLQEKLSSSENFHKELTTERAAMIQEIWDELTAVQQKFEKQLEKLAQTTLTQLNGICADAEDAITASQNSCASDSKSHAAEKQAVIDKAIKEFMHKLEGKKETVLEGINKAAGISTSPKPVENVQEDDAEPADDASGGADEQADTEGGDGTPEALQKKGSKRRSRKNKSEKRTPGDDKK